jgi:hypothetical protein
LTEARPELDFVCIVLDNFSINVLNRGYTDAGLSQKARLFPRTAQENKVALFGIDGRSAQNAFSGFFM